MDRQYVGIDFHRRRSVIVRKDASGDKLGSVRVANDPLAIAAVIADAPGNELGMAIGQLFGAAPRGGGLSPAQRQTYLPPHLSGAHSVRRPIVP